MDTGGGWVVMSSGHWQWGVWLCKTDSGGVVCGCVKWMLAVGVWLCKVDAGSGGVSVDTGGEVCGYVKWMLVVGVWLCKADTGRVV